MRVCCVYKVSIINTRNKIKRSVTSFNIPRL
uniref:Uncharacterized protein n=1 Tax=Ciona intestinalis TaxID=7719 RepID=H2XUL5_CIOIN